MAPVNGFVSGFIPGFVISKNSLLGSSNKVFLHCRHVSCIPNVRRDAYGNLSFSVKLGSAGARDPGREQSSPPWGFLIDVVKLFVSKHVDFCSKVDEFISQLGSVLVSIDLCNVCPNRDFV
jgi:hypothetical protein